LFSLRSYGALAASQRDDGIGVMNDKIDDGNQTDEDLLFDDISDEVLEAAAGTTKDTLMTLPGGLSVNIMCCGPD